MKKFKYVTLTLFSLLLCFGFAACSGQAGRYIDGSFLYDCEVYVYTNQIRVETKFAVKTPDKSRYDVSYTVSLYDGSKKIDGRKVNSSITPEENNMYIVSEYYYVDMSENDIIPSASNLIVKITDLSVTPAKTSTEYKNYAIGFGITGGALLLSTTALFVILQIKNKSK